MTINIPKIDPCILQEIKSKFDNNTATSDEYESLDYHLSSFGLNNYIIGKLNAKGIVSYQLFIDERKRPISQRNTSIDELYGNILGVIKFLLTVIK